MTRSTGPGELASSINLGQNARYILEKRYLKRDGNSRPVETPEHMFRRVARSIAAADLIYDPKADINSREHEFYRLMTSLDFLPNSPTLLNAGHRSGQLSSCFALPVLDSMESIFKAVKNTALVHKSGGGTGFSFSRLRPEKGRVGTITEAAGGPVSFLPVFSAAADSVKQGGIRRGCSTAVLGVDHPDIMKFITAKDNPSALTNFYLLVAASDQFMEAIDTNADYTLINPHTREVAARLKARELFDSIVEQTWKTGDPGIIFIDRINEANPTPHLGNIESVSGCGEQLLLPYESCNLGSINLTRMLRRENGNVAIDYDRMAGTVKTAVRFLDNVIDVNRFPLPEIEEMTRKTRKIGLGVMGFADMLIQLGIPYDSEEALGIAAEVMQFISEQACQVSSALAEERGVFPAFSGSIHDVAGGPRLRNASCTTIAPTGTLSMIAGCSCSIEPNFALSFVRHITDGEPLLEINPYFEKIARQEGFYSEELIKKLVSGIRLSDLADVPRPMRQLLVTAHDIDTRWHIRMQAAFQRHTDNAVSKTVNLPHAATREDVAKVYRMAYEEGLKGITVYRDGSRRQQPLCTGQVGLDLIDQRFAAEAASCR